MSSGNFCYRCLLNRVQEEFKAEQLAASEGRSVDWSFASNALQLLETIDEGSGVLNVHWRLDDASYEAWKKGCQVHGQNHMDGFWEIFEFFMTSFETLNLRDSTIAADLLCEAHYFMKKYDFKFRYSSLDFPVYSRRTCFCGFRMCRLGMQTRTDFRKLLKTVYEIPSSMIVDIRDIYVKSLAVWSAVRAGNERALSGLLRYGVMFLPASYYVIEDWVHWQSSVRYLLYERRNRRPYGYFPFNDAIRKLWVNPVSRRLFIVLMHVELLAVELEFGKDEPETENAPPRKRLCLDSNPSDGRSSRSVYFRCLQRAFETIPEPFVFGNDLRKTFRVVYGASSNEETELHINELIAKYEELFPEAAQPSAPRSLQHLSRCQVRENLRQAGTLPHGVRDLKLSTLGKYILLER